MHGEGSAPARVGTADRHLEICGRVRPEDERCLEREVFDVGDADAKRRGECDFQQTGDGEDKAVFDPMVAEPRLGLS